MTRRECQSCRFFQAAGFDKMGWCTHPKRRIGSDARIFVRAQQLPCRNDWAHDLWQAADQTDSDVVIDTTAGPVAPATPAEIAVVAAIDQRPKPDNVAASAAARGEDVVVGEVTASIAAGEMSQPSNERQTLRRAHDEIKRHKREPRSIVSPALDDSQALGSPVNAAWPATDPPLKPDLSVSPSRPSMSSDTGMLLPKGDVSPVAMGEIGRHFPKMTIFPDDDEVFSAIPQKDETFDLPIVRRSDAPRIVGRAGFDDEQPAPAWEAANDPAAGPRTDDDPVFTDVPVATELASSNDDFTIDDFTMPGDSPAPRRRFLPRPRQRPVRPALPPADDILTNLYAEPELAPYLEQSEAEWPVAAAHTSNGRSDTDFLSDSLGIDGLLDDLQIDDPSPYAEPEFRERRKGLWGRKRHDRHSAYEDDYVTAYAEEHDLAAPSNVYDEVPEPPISRAEINEPVEDFVVSPRAIMDEVVDEAPLWAAIPRMCRSCRDFRPAESGDRGWCTNKWAFNHRRMVDADELPCETSVGRWWLPHDEFWMAGADITAHSQPTPLLDQWLAHRAAANGEYDAVTPMRRRQRS